MGTFYFIKIIFIANISINKNVLSMSLNNGIFNIYFSFGRFISINKNVLSVSLNNVIFINISHLAGSYLLIKMC